MRVYPFIVVLNLLVLLKLRVNAYPVPMTLVANAAAKGAVCLDGSPPAYHFSPGFGSGANNWLVHMEGGGWCCSIEECVERQNNFRGSSTKMKPLSFSGILGNQKSSNPDFYNYKVKVRYCDGSSFTGDVESVVQQRNFILEDLEFGLRLWKSYWLREFKMHKMLCFLGVQLVDWHLYFIVIRSVIFYQPVQKLNAFRMLDFSSMRRMFLEQITSMNSFLLL